jgi:Fe-S-cluster containining protein
MSTVLEPTALLEQAPPMAAAADPCATCGICCRAYYVPVSGFDVWRISQALGLDPSDFVAAFPRRPGDDFGFQLCAGGDFYELALEKHGDFERGQPCVFLESSEDGTSRCGIYTVRPAVCRAYPMVAGDDGVIALRPRALCPSGAWPASEPEQPSWHAAWDDLRAQFDEYRQIVDAWNAQVAKEPGREFSMSQYLTYLIGVYKKLAAARAT